MLISCLCLTRKRREWLPRAIGCFQAQTYAEKELIILADEPGDTDGLIPNNPRIAVFFGRWPKIGTKRNAACDRARGKFLASWDDDDVSGPGRLQDQATRLLESGKSVTSYRNVPFTDGTNRWINTNWPGGYGSTLMFKKSWWEKNRFPDQMIGEDWEFVSHAMRMGEYVCGEAGEHFEASIHPGNSAGAVVGQGWVLR